MTPLADAGARHRITTDLEATLFVEAAAGTGKTTALVERVVNLVGTGAATIRRVAAITFTEKAAGELRNRLRNALRQAEAERPGPEAERCRAALNDFDDATVCTLHAFAQRLLAEFPLEVGLPPRFDVLDELQAQARFDTGWGRFVGRLLDGADGDDPTVRDALDLGLRPHDLRALALAFHHHWDRVEHAAIPALPLPAADAQPVVSALDDALAAGRACSDPDDKLAAHIAALEPWRERLSQAEPGPDTLDLLALAPAFAKRSGGQQGNWGGKELLESARGHLERAEAARHAVLDGTRAALATDLGERIRRYTLDQADDRRQSGQLEFHDLLVLARRLLRTSPEARAALQGRWTHLLIDEFQDTDPLQIELAVLLAAADLDVADTPWDALTIAPGRLFMVGDPKQSIYRFRRADIALYHRVQARFTAGLETLATNFRCAPPIVAWVNHALAALMGSGAEGLQAAYRELDAGRDADAPSVHAIGAPIDGAMGGIRQREADDVAAAVAAARADGWTVHDEDGGSARAARYADIAVLLPTRTLLPELERALDRADIPYRIESRSLLWNTQEVRDLLAVLRAVDDPTDEIALIAALRCPALACSDHDLAAFRAAGGVWSHAAEQPQGIPDPVAHALAVLGTLHQERHWLPLHTMVETVLRRLGMMQLQGAHPRPRDHWRRLRFVADQARAFESAGGATLRAFVDWADAQAEADVAVNESIVAEGDDDAVRVMTVHAAKGLEFPIVVLAGINSNRPDRRPAVLYRADGLDIEVGPSHARFATPGYEAALARERAAEAAEEVRLLYVAATRARDHLVISLHRKDGGRPTAAHHIARVCGDAGDLWASPEGGTPDGGAPPPAPATPPEAQGWLEERARLFAEAGASPVVAATALGAEPDVSDVPDERPAWQRGRAGTSIGRAVHAVLQSVDLATGEGLEAVAGAQAVGEGIAERSGEVARLARAALGSDVVRRAAASERYWREVALVVPFDDILFEGYVDLLFEDPGDGSLTVVDYKTDRVSTPGELSERYRLQGAAYAAALEASLGRPVGRCVFVFVGDGTAREVAVDDLPAAVAEARSRIASAPR